MMYRLYAQLTKSISDEQLQKIARYVYPFSDNPSEFVYWSESGNPVCVIMQSTESGESDAERMTIRMRHMQRMSRERDSIEVPVIDVFRGSMFEGECSPEVQQAFRAKTIDFFDTYQVKHEVSQTVAA